jgi:tRNA G18 (ribose-2'-O)-methylase SpoU
MDPSIFVALRDRDLRRKGLLVAEGRLLAERLLASGWPVLAVLCAPRFTHLFRERTAGVCPLHVLPDERIAEVAGYAFHRGVLAVGRRPPLPGYEQLLAEADRPSTLVVCPDVAGAENLGSIIRTAAALGVGGLLLGPRSCDPFSRRALKVSMGAAFSIPLAVVEDEDRACAGLREGGYTVAIASLAPEALPLQSFRRGRKLCLVLGNEAAGVGEPWISCCDVRLSIPMSAGTDSLNVAVAAGIFLHALRA